jgi:fumarate hydratase class I
MHEECRSMIRDCDVVASVADALQFISYYHPPDFIAAMREAYERERSEAAKDAIAQILANSRMAAEGHRPVCQDTGIVVVFAKVGMHTRWDSQRTLTEMINDGVRQAYTHEGNPLRASIVADPAGLRTNTRDNTPAVVHTELVPGEALELNIAAKGGGSENKAIFQVLNPADSVCDWVVDRVRELGAGWCPPGILGIGIGGTPEKALLMAKEALLEPIDIADVKARGARNPLEQLRIRIFDRVNSLGIGAQGLGGLTTVLDVKIRDYPTHAASLPVAIIPNCAATRHIHFRLDGSGPARFEAPAADQWPIPTPVFLDPPLPVNLDTLTREDVVGWRSGQRLLLSGRLLTGRDAAHRKICSLLEASKPLPDNLSFQGRVIYYVGPVDPVGTEVVGPAGPTTAARMDRYTETMLAQAGLLAMIGKGERGPVVIDAIRRHRSAYLIAVGGAAYLLARAIRAAKVVAFPELGMEAVYEFRVHSMPVTVAIDADGDSLHERGPAQWQAQLRGIPIIAA